jgi:hypothetical protein
MDVSICFDSMYILDCGWPVMPYFGSAEHDAAFRLIVSRVSGLVGMS